MKLDPKNTVYLIDGSSFLYRAYYSLRPLHTPNGVAVQAVYGFCRMIKKLVDTFDPTYIALVWDSKGKTTRHELYQEYKATRQPPPSDLFVQKEFIVDFADDIGLFQLQQPGIEADDLLYSCAQECIKEGKTVVLISSDKDMAQAINEQIIIYDPIKDSFINGQKFEQEKGFGVQKLPFYFALLGDASDNIPGVKGIGKTGATQLVKQFSSLQDLYDNIQKVENARMRTALKQYQDDAFLSLKLFTLQYHPTGLTSKDLVFDKKNWANARVLFQELNFKSLLKDLPHTTTQVQPADILPGCTFVCVTTIDALQQLCTLIKQQKLCALDTETLGLNPLLDAAVGISVCVQEGTTYYIPFGHTTGEQQLSKQGVVDAFKPLFEDPSIEKYLHNAKFDALVLHAAGIHLRGVTFDTMIAASLLMTEEWQRFGLKFLSMHYFNEPMLSFVDVVKAYKRDNFGQVPLELATKYAAADAHQTLKLKKVLEAQLQKDQQLWNLFNDIEMPISHILTHMELTGIHLDASALHGLDITVTKKLRAIEHEIATLTGTIEGAINLNSPKQVEELLFVRLQLPPQKKSAKGTSYSTDQEVLTVLATMHPIPGLIMQHRELAKLKSTYIDALPTYINPKTGNIHTTFSQVGVATGRLASSDPNLQNIPADSTGYGIEIRAAFKPPHGYLFLSADYSQIELRVLAQFSGDTNLLDAFLHGHDIHAQTASRLFDVAMDKVSHEQRQIGKRINFSILYGLTPYGLSKDLGIPFKDAKIYIEKYFAQYPGVSAWMQQVIEQTKKDGYVETWWGRRRAIPGIYEKNKVLFEEACRIAINTKAQGTAAEIMKKGMIALQKAMAQQQLDGTMILQIHDELLLTINPSQQQQAEELVKKVLEGVVDWRVPLKVTTRCGKNWKDVTK